jgi:hypothetical protein
MVGRNNLDLHSLCGRVKILNGHLGGNDRARATRIGIEARHVGKDPNLDDSVGVLGVGPAAEEDSSCCDQSANRFHHFTPAPARLAPR